MVIVLCFPSFQAIVLLKRIVDDRIYDEEWDDENDDDKNDNEEVEDDENKTDILMTMTWIRLKRQHNKHDFDCWRSNFKRQKRGLYKKYIINDLYSPKSSISICSLSDSTLNWNTKINNLLTKHKKLCTKPKHENWFKELTLDLKEMGLRFLIDYAKTQA